MAVEVDRLVTVLEARYGQYLRDLSGAQQQTNRRLGDIERRFAQTNASVSRSIGSMGAVIGTIGAYLSVDQVVAYANAWTRVTRSIDAGGDVFGITLKSAEELTDLANEARIDVEAYAKTFIRTAAAIRDYGMDANVAAEVTSTLAKALKLGSASASEQASTILQFSQALQKGKLDGDEFRTVMENAGVIQELLAKRLRVTKGEIVKMAADGKLQLLDLVGAMRDGKDMIDAIFNSQPTTVDEAFTKLNNSITRFVGEMDAAYGITTTMTGALDFLASNIDTVGKAALVAGIGLLAMFAPAIIGGIVALGAGAAVAAGGLGALTGVLGAGAAAFSLFGDQIGVAEEGLVSLKDIVRATAEELRALTEEEQRLAAFSAGGFADAFGEGIADRIRRNAKAGALGRGFADGTTVTKSRPTHALAKVVDADAEKRQKRFDRELSQTERQIEMVEAEARAVGQSAHETARLRKEQELLTSARENDIALTPQVLADIDQMSLRFANAVTQAEALREAYELMAAESKEFLSDFIKGMKDGESATDLLADALDNIANKLIDMAVNDLVESALGGLLGGGGSQKGGSLAGGILSILGFAEGGRVRGPGTGTSDSIVARLSNDEYVVKATSARKYGALLDAINNDRLPKFANGGPVGVPSVPSIPQVAAASAPSNVQITVAPTFNVQNGTPEGVDKLKHEMVPVMRDIARTEFAVAFDRADGLRRMKGG